MVQLKTEKDRREFFALKPCNLMTWPELLRQFLGIVHMYRHSPGVTTADTVRMFRQVPKGRLAACLDLLGVLTSHPLAGPFLEPVNTNDLPGYLLVIKFFGKGNRMRERMGVGLRVVDWVGWW